MKLTRRQSYEKWLALKRNLDAISSTARFPRYFRVFIALFASLALWTVIIAGISAVL
jgi:hypothetical protein